MQIGRDNVVCSDCTAIGCRHRLNHCHHFGCWSFLKNVDPGSVRRPLGNHVLLHRWSELWETKRKYRAKIKQKVITFRNVDVKGVELASLKSMRQKYNFDTNEMSPRYHTETCVNSDRKTNFVI